MNNQSFCNIKLNNWLSLDQSEKGEHKNNLKGKLRHVDICSNEQLKDINPNSIDNDNIVNIMRILMDNL